MSFSQTAIETASNDSLVIMNKRLVTFMIKDLIQYDASKQDVD